MSSKRDSTDSSDYARTKMWILILGIVLVATNLRAPLTAVGPLIGDIRSDTGISNALAGMLTTLSLFAFAFLSPFAPKIARKIGMEATLLWSLLVLTVGILLRSVPSVGTLFMGTALLGMAIAIGNVLLPSMIKRDFPQKIGTMTGLYSVSMNLWGAIASGITIPLSHSAGFGWRGSLACWAVLSVVALVAWLPLFRSPKRTAAAQGGMKPVTQLWRSRLAWQVTLFMGLQSLVYYTNIAWIPEILHQRGIDYTTGGWMLSIMQLLSLPATFIMPVLAGRSSNQRGLVSITAAFLVIGYAGLLWGNSLLMPICTALIGIAAGASFSLAVMFFSLRSRSVQESAELSSMAQTIGYLLAAAGPALFGFIHDMTQGWTIPLLMLVGVAVLIFIFGLGAGSNRYINSEEENQKTALFS